MTPGSRARSLGPNAAGTDSTPAAATLRVAADLVPLLFSHHRRGPIRVGLDGTSSVLHLTESVGIPRTEVGDLTIGTHAVDRTYVPVAGEVIDVESVDRPQRHLPQRYLLDVHLGALARRMRLVGLDTWYSNDAADQALVEVANRTGRVLLTKDRGLLCRRALAAGVFVRGSQPMDQLADVLDRLAPTLDPWSRCPSCNGLLRPVGAASVATLLEPGTRQTYDRFSQCTDCGRPYWRGAHATDLEAIIERARECAGNVPASTASRSSVRRPGTAE